MELTEPKGGQIVLAQRITREDEALASASARIACVNTVSFKPVRIPGILADALFRYGASE